MSNQATGLERAYQETVKEKWQLFKENMRLREALNLIRYDPINAEFIAEQALTANAELRGAKPIGEASLSNDVLCGNATENRP